MAWLEILHALIKSPAGSIWTPADLIDGSLTRRKARWLHTVNNVVANPGLGALHKMKQIGRTPRDSNNHWSPKWHHYWVGRPWLVFAEEFYFGALAVLSVRPGTDIRGGGHARFWSSSALVSARSLVRSGTRPMEFPRLRGPLRAAPPVGKPALAPRPPT